MKWFYIKEISKRSSKYGDLLIQMMDEYNKSSLAEMDENEVKDFYLKIIKNHQNFSIPK